MLRQFRSIERTASIQESFRRSLEGVLGLQRTTANMDTARIFEQTIRGVIDASRTMGTSLARQLEASARGQQNALRNASFHRALEGAFATRRAIETSLASQLEASARTQHAVFRNPSLERFLQGVLDGQKALTASLASRLEASMASQGDALRAASVLAIQNTARQHERIARDLRSLDAFGSQALSKLISDGSLAASGSTASLERPLSGAFGAWDSAIGTDFARDVESALASQVAEERDVSIVDAVTDAIGQAMRQNQSRTDWRFVAALIVSLLFFLYQNYSADLDEKVLREDIAAVQERLLSQEYLLQLLLTKEVRRSTPLYSRPTSRSKNLGRLQEGTVVIVLGRRNKWTRIGLRSDSDETKIPPFTGWLLNKYLK